MQIDATSSKLGFKRGLPKGPRRNDRKPIDKSQVECYGCGKKGHFKRDCRGKKPDYELPRRQIAATNTVRTKETKKPDWDDSPEWKGPPKQETTPTATRGTPYESLS